MKHVSHTHKAPSDLQFKVQLHAPPAYVVRIPFYNTLEWWISFLQVTVFEKIHTLSICFCDESVHFFIVPAEEQVTVFGGFRIFFNSPVITAARLTAREKKVRWSFSQTLG